MSLFAITPYADNWQSKIDGTKVNFIAKDGYIYRYCDVGGSKFLVPATDQQVKLLEEAGMLTDISYEVQSDWPKIPGNLMRFALDYFAAVFAKSQCEAAVLLYYNTETKAWAMVVPVQYNCSHASVSYAIPNGKTLREIESDEVMLSQYNASVEEAEILENDGYSLIGTIHSHCDFSAFHSGVDDADEFKFDGIHITIGHVDRADHPSKDGAEPSYAARLIVNGTEIKKEIEEVAVLTTRKKIKITQDMMDRHHKRTATSFSGTGRAFNLLDHSDSWTANWSKDNDDRWFKDYDRHCLGNDEPKQSFDSDYDDRDDALDLLIPEEDVVILTKGKRKYVIDSDSYDTHAKTLRKLGYK
jgi:hypothetical protein